MADVSTTRRVARHMALTLIVALQVSHFILQTLDRWGPPRKANAVLMTLAKLSELGFIAITCGRIVWQTLDVRLGRHMIRGQGIEVLLCGVALWSAACVACDKLVSPDGLVSLAQLMAVDVVRWTDILSGAVGLVDPKEMGGYEAVAGDEKGAMLDEKMEV